MKKIVLILVLLIVVFSGCFQPVEPPKELPSDFEVEYENGAMHLEWGHYELKIDNAGKALFKKTIETDLSKEYKFDVSTSERKKIYDSVVINGFFNLNQEYSDPFTMDGGFSKISIKAEGKTKTVTVINYSQEQFNKVKNEIGRLITSKIGEKAFDFTDLRDDCSEKENECQGKESMECMEWKKYCEWNSLN